jgi:hypothetical protein
LSGSLAICIASHEIPFPSVSPCICSVVACYGFGYWAFPPRKLPTTPNLDAFAASAHFEKTADPQLENFRNVLK